MTTLGIVLKGDDKALTGKPLMKRTMQIWINAVDWLCVTIFVVTRLNCLVTSGTFARIDDCWFVTIIPRARFDQGRVAALFTFASVNCLQIIATITITCGDKFRVSASISVARSNCLSRIVITIFSIASFHQRRIAAISIARVNSL